MGIVMKKTLPIIIIMLLLLTVAGSGCIGGSKTKISTTTMYITRSVTTTATVTSDITHTKTVSSYYITTVYSTHLETVTIPITTTIIINGSTTSTIISNSSGQTTLMKFVGEYTYSEVPFLVYSINGNTKEVTIPASLSPLIAPIISFIHTSIENKYTSYTDLGNYIGDFQLLRVKIMMANFKKVETPINYSELYYGHEYNNIYGALYYAGFAINSHRPVTIILAAKNGTVIDAFMGFDNTYYSFTKVMNYNALQYSWFTRYGTYTALLLVLDENGIVTKLDSNKVTTIPQSFDYFTSMMLRKAYGLEFVITSSQITKIVSYFINVSSRYGTIWTTIDTYTETTKLYYTNNNLVMITYKPTKPSNATKTVTITITNSYYAPPYYMGVDYLQFFPQNSIDYNVRVIDGVVMYTIYRLNKNTLTIEYYTISKTQIINASYYEIGIGNVTIASGTIAGWVS